MPLLRNASLATPHSSLSGRVEPIIATIFLALVVFAPSLINYLFGTSSHAAGTAAASVGVIAVLAFYLRIDRWIAIYMMAAIVVLIHLIGASLLHEVQMGRAVMSLGLVGLVLAATLAFGAWLFHLSETTATRMISNFRILMVVIGIFGALEIQPGPINLELFGFGGGGALLNKPVFPFTEPSHFALAFTPLLIAAAVFSQGTTRYLWLIVGLALAYFLQNLTLMVGVALAASLSLSIGRLLGGVLLVALAVPFLDLEYFSDRLNFSIYSTNLSTLIYIQGWELVQDSFEKTSGWGLGFQQLGLGYINSDAAEVIYRMGRFELNLQDGGFTAAKVIGEFGILGLILVGIYMYIAAKAGITLRRIAKGQQEGLAIYIYACSLICGFSVDLFVRGVGYFTSSTFMFLSIILYFGRATQAQKDLLASYPATPQAASFPPKLTLQKQED